MPSSQSPWCHSKTEIYLVRHGETEWNAQGRCQGKLDSPLTPRGRAQARAYGVMLVERANIIDALYSSPRGRARQTVDIIRTCGPFPETRWDDRLEEMSFGSWDGLTQIEINARWPGLLDRSTPYNWYFRSPDGESYNQALRRARGWLGDVHGTVIAVSHALIGRIVRGAYLGLSKHDTLSLPVDQDVVWRLANGTVTAIPI
jgi:broad specificity phosphatase PhoE